MLSLIASLSLRAATLSGTSGSATPYSHASYANVPWPLPQKMSAGNATVVLVGTAQSLLACGAAADGCDPAACPEAWPRAPCRAGSAVACALERYAPLFTRGPSAEADETITKIEVCVANRAAPLGPAMNESYSLHVPASGGKIRIDAPTQHGVMRALESLAHLISLPKPARIVNAPVTIHDAPRWPVRGLMVNPAGRFMSLDTLMRIVDGLVVNKMNCA